MSVTAEKTPDRNSEITFGMSVMQKIQNLHLGFIYEAGGEGPINTLWPRRVSRYGLRVVYNL